ncbi:GNAT family N-acetyltransferase [Pseudorhizobium endolithicum]|uniref:GNAT family N-acetyltransferase n=1 Tax=Pseudorhizobium endolithicum TaxID=1191678 RepID=A0ABM8PY59_9HYPH|nr:GNAT family N-acetyltransferase [Pseudorhizobium endolithicum]CAD7054615.1 GNAT family N-acetyltransferase [Pseudorhizobium endolithicum]
MTDSFEIVTRDRLEDLSPEWPSGAPSSRLDVGFHAFQSRGFLQAWMASFGRAGGQTFHFIELRDGSGNPALFVPVRILKRSGIRILQFIDHDAADYNAPIIFRMTMNWTVAQAEKLWRRILAQLPSVDVVELTKMPKEVEGVANPLAFLGDRASDLSCHATDLRRSWPQIDAEVPRRTTLLRKIRGLERVAPVGFHLAETEEEVKRITEVMLRQKQRRFEETMVPGFDVDRDKHDFFRDGTEVFQRCGMLKLFYLTAGETVVATIWGLVSGKRYYAIMLSFEGGEWTRHSPGSILFYRCLQWLHGNGYEWMDLGIGNEPWKLESCRTTIPLVERREALTLRGRLYLQRVRLAERMRKLELYQRLRPMKWILLRKLRSR